MSSGMSQLIGLKEKGLPQIARLLQSGNSDVVRSGASLLSNMSRHQPLHGVMGEAPSPSRSSLGSIGRPHFPDAAERSPSNCSLACAFIGGKLSSRKGQATRDGQQMGTVLPGS